jgi:hypothetical protein
LDTAEQLDDDTAVQVLSPQAKAWSLMGIPLTEKEYLFVSHLRTGSPPAIAASSAGYAAPATTGPALLRRPHIRTLVTLIQEEMQEEMGVSRGNVVHKLCEAFDLARTIEDPGSMVRACNELNRMFGYHAPEKKELRLGSMGHAAASMAAAPDEELWELLEGEDSVWSQISQQPQQ